MVYVLQKCNSEWQNGHVCIGLHDLTIQLYSNAHSTLSLFNINLVCMYTTVWAGGASHCLEHLVAKLMSTVQVKLNSSLFRNLTTVWTWTYKKQWIHHTSKSQEQSCSLNCHALARARATCTPTHLMELLVSCFLLKSSPPQDGNWCTPHQ